MPDLLEVKGLTASYGATQVLFDIDFRLAQGEITAILGANGAGKTTTLRAICQAVKTGGSVLFDGQQLVGKSTESVVRLGVAQVPDGRGTFTALSVEDNLLIGTYAKAPRGDRSKLERIYALFPELAERRQQMASRLSGGQQQFLAVAQGVIGEPRLLLLDEPSAGLAPIVIDRILGVAAQLCAEGLAILLVEQLVEKALRHAHWGYIVETGRIPVSAPVEALRDGELVRQVYLGAGARHEETRA